MSDVIWVAMVGAVGAVLAAAIPAWLSNRKLNQVQRSTSQLEPNGGSSLSDKVDVIVMRLGFVDEKVDFVGTRLEDHVQKTEEYRQELSSQMSKLEERFPSE